MYVCVYVFFIYEEKMFGGGNLDICVLWNVLENKTLFLKKREGGDSDITGKSKNGVGRWNCLLSRRLPVGEISGRGEKSFNKNVDY